MANIKFKCPKCGSINAVSLSKGDHDTIAFCVNCGYKMKLKLKSSKKVDNQMPQASQGGETVYGPVKSNDTRNHQNTTSSQNGETVYGPTSQNNTIDQDKTELLSAVTSCFLSVNGIKYPLLMGVNIIGRDAPTSTATVKIRTTDRFVSRAHAIIDITGSNGTNRASIAYAGQNKNPIYINNQLLHNCDKVILANGSIIRIGNTIIKYICQ